VLADAVEHVASGVALALALAEVTAVLDVVLGRAVQVSYSSSQKEGRVRTHTGHRLQAFEKPRRFYIPLLLSCNVPDPEM
jgi:hypothetical protein